MDGLLHMDGAKLKASTESRTSGVAAFEFRGFSEGLPSLAVLVQQFLGLDGTSGTLQQPFAASAKGIGLTVTFSWTLFISDPCRRRS